MDWPPQSQDLNFIDAVGDHLDREWKNRQPTSKENLNKFLSVPQQAWTTITKEYLKVA